MASSSGASSSSSRNSFDIVNGRWIVPKFVASDPEFSIVLSAYQGRNIGYAF
jgi:hypothetical protein